VPAGSGVDVEVAVPEGAANVFAAKPRMVEVPDLAGDLVKIAARRLKSISLQVGEKTRRPSDRPEGTVVGQSPPPGTEVRVGSRVNLVLAQRVAELIAVRVPKLIGLEQEEALGRLADRDLVGVVEERPSVKPLRTVIEQDPVPGSRARPGDSVRLVVVDPQLVKVPDLKHLRVAFAESRLQRVGLQLGEQDKTPSRGPEGTIVGQSPRAGRLIPIGSSVDLIIAQQVAAPPDDRRAWVPTARDLLSAGAGTAIGILLGFLFARGFRAKPRPTPPPPEGFSVSSTKGRIDRQIEPPGNHIEAELHVRPHTERNRHEIEPEQDLIVKEERIRD
jgi:beta-lactam-binding protein with PASTA domain